MFLFSFIYRENRVPYFQRLFQAHDGVRQWNKVSSQSLPIPSYFALSAARTGTVLQSWNIDRMIGFSLSLTANYSSQLDATKPVHVISLLRHPLWKLFHVNVYDGTARSGEIPTGFLEPELQPTDILLLYRAIKHYGERAEPTSWRRSPFCPSSGRP